MYPVRDCFEGFMESGSVTFHKGFQAISNFKILGGIYALPSKKQERPSPLTSKIESHARSHGFFIFLCNFPKSYF